ncbi:hypothetical protein GVN16_16380 [Emticicia sp. CRIBPO]|uniref:hypothetical protein n=1 Tax=Emticicia sp. CRIBPO TaxID=2683258 RepID=UPI001412638B|nr:hypothetical protein [Emticicia sp. CRIBPO]NBA87353.1 hypothetical protein [Emticicia sp. CRIBPO]
MGQLFFLKLLNVVILLSGVAGFVRWKEIKDSYWKWFPVYLIILGLLNLLAFYMIDTKNIKSNQWLVIYLIIPFEFLFAFWLFLKKAETRPQKTLILTGMGVYLLSFFIEILLKEEMKELYFLSFSYTMGNIFMLIFILLYFWKLSVSEKILFFYRERMFWVCVGMLFFWLGSLPYYGLFNYMVKNFMNILPAYAWLMLSLNYLMYTLFAVSFIWGKEN